MGLLTDNGRGEYEEFTLKHGGKFLYTPEELGRVNGNGERILVNRENLYLCKYYTTARGG